MCENIGQCRTCKHYYFEYGMDNCKVESPCFIEWHEDDIKVTRCQDYVEEQDFCPDKPLYEYATYLNEVEPSAVSYSGMVSVREALLARAKQTVSRSEAESALNEVRDIENFLAKNPKNSLLA